MNVHSLLHLVETYLQTLCLEIPSRLVGSPGNRQATDFFAHVAASFGFTIETPHFDCIHWTSEGAQLNAAQATFHIFPSPYTLGCQVQAPLAVLSSIAELETKDISHKLVLLKGELAQEQLMPKNFTFYNPEHHQRIIRLLESKAPQAILAATARNPEMAGAVYPFPLIEDGDFDVPSAYMTDVEGQRLAQLAGENLQLTIQAQRSPAKGCNVIANKGSRDKRIVLFAHIDTKGRTPGALDNASGVVVLLLLAELMQNYNKNLGIEIVALNGEDYYSAPGEMQYLQRNQDRYHEIVLGINLDGVGYRHGRVSYSLYGCPAWLDSLVRYAFLPYSQIAEGEPWYQGDHGLFLQNQRPALAITSDCLGELLAKFIHTPADTPELIDCEKLVSTARALHDLLLAIDRHLAIQ